MKRWLIIWCLLFGFSAAVFSQTLEMEDLRKNRERTLKELNETNKNVEECQKFFERIKQYYRRNQAATESYLENQ